MTQVCNKPRIGSRRSSSVILAVWNKARPIPGEDPSTFRLDCCGARIRYGHYQVTDSEEGWEIDRVRSGGPPSDDPAADLQPFHWRNNRQRGLGCPPDACEVC